MNRHFSIIVLPLMLSWCPFSSSGLDQYTRARLSVGLGLDHASFALKEITAEMDRREAALCGTAGVAGDNLAKCKALVVEQNPWLEKAKVAHTVIDTANRELQVCRLNKDACKNLNLLFSRALVAAAELISWAESEDMKLSPSAVEVKKQVGC